MGKNYYEFDSKELMNVVDRAIKSKEFQQLSKQVATAVSKSVSQASAGAHSQYAEMQRRTAERQAQLAQRNQQASQQQDLAAATAAQANPVLYNKQHSQRVVGILQSVAGFSGTAIFGAIDIGFVAAWLSSSFDPVLTAMTVLFSGLLAASTTLGVMGIHKCNLVARFKHYLRVIGNRASCSVQELQNSCGRDAKHVVKDLKELIRKGYFAQGRLDVTEQNLFLTADAYQQHALTESQAAQQAQLQAAEAQRHQQLPAASRSVLAEGKQYIQFIHQANDRLPGEAISTKLDRLETIITRIFSEVEKDPSTAGDLKKFMNYYLPTTKKLVQTYCELDKEPIPSEKMKQTKHEIESALDTINQAFETLLDDLYHDTALDISSDIQVLQTMLTQEGLANNGFGSIK